MKATSIFFVLYFFISVVNAQWTLQNPLPTACHLNDVDFIDNNVGISVGDKGTVLRSTNGGTDWVSVTVSTVADLVSIDCYSSNLFIAVGNDGYSQDQDTSICRGVILISTDQGLSWSVQNTNYNEIFREVNFISSNEGIIIGGRESYGSSLLFSTAFILKTNDGGITWNYVYHKVNNSVFGWDFRPLNIATNNNKVYCCLKDGNLLKSVDNGNTWVADSIGNFISGQICYFANDTVFLCDGSNIYKSYDDGNIWSQLSLPFYSLKTVFLNLNNAIGVSNHQIYSSIDTGNNWSLITDTIQDINNFTVLPSTDISIIGEYGKLYLMDLTLPSVIQCFDGFYNGIMYAVSFPSNQIGYTCSSHGNIYATINSGFNWTKQFSNVDPLYDIFFIDQTNGLACGSYSLIKTSDGGLTWTQVTLPASVKDLTSVFILNNSIAYSVGYDTSYDGVFLKTTDGGSTWNSISPGYNEEFYDVYFIDQNIGFISGGNGLILKTTDGGLTWNEKIYTSGGYLYSFAFPSSTIGYCSGEGNILYKTQDAGETWQALTAPVNGEAPELFFFDVNVGFFADDEGLFKTENGGVSWTKQLDHILGGIDFSDSSHGWVVGGGSAIFYNDDEQVGIEESIISEVKIYPNPATSYFSIDFPLNEKYNIEVINSLGDVVFKDESIKNTFDCSNLSNGFYVIKLTDKGGRIYLNKLIVNK
ncbi:MAG: YCF48-related protein [Bacteroidota bacterium]